MSQVSKVILGSLAATLTLGAVQFATGQEFAGRFQAVTEPAGIDVNRTIKADREANIPSASAPTRTISLKVDSLVETSVLVRVPAREARNLPPRPAATMPPARKPDRKMVACEPTVSVLTEVAKLLQPGRCVT